jgi:hypothetical protein
MKYSVLVGKSEERDHYEDLDQDGMATFKLILKTGSEKGVGFIDMFHHGQMANFCEHNNKSVGFTNLGEFLD